MGAGKNRNRQRCGRRSGDPDPGGLCLVSCGLGRASRALTATVGLWLRSGGMAPAVQGRGGSAEALGSWGAGPGDGMGPGHRLRVRWPPRKRCRTARVRAGSLLSESRRALASGALASSGLTLCGNSSEQRRGPGLGLAGEPG